MLAKGLTSTVQYYEVPGWKNQGSLSVEALFVAFLRDSLPSFHIKLLQDTKQFPGIVPMAQINLILAGLNADVRGAAILPATTAMGVLRYTFLFSKSKFE